MPSIQWGSTGTAQFTWNPVSGALANLPNAAATLAILWKPASSGAADALGLRDATNLYHLLTCFGNNWSDDDGIVGATDTQTVTANHWYVTVVDWPAGTALERFHAKDLTAATAWAHDNSTGNNGGNRAGPTGANGLFCTGYGTDNTATSGTQIALIAAWAGVALGDTNAALLTTSLKTSDWYNSPAGRPTFLAEITTLTPTDLISGNAFSAVKSLTTGLTVAGDPAGGWTFDGTGTPAIISPPRRTPLGV